MSKKFLKAAIAIGLILHRISFKTTLFELFSAVCAYKTLWMEFFRHRSYNASTNSFTANATLMDFSKVQNMKSKSIKQFLVADFQWYLFLSYKTKIDHLLTYCCHPQHPFAQEKLFETFPTCPLSQNLHIYRLNILGHQRRHFPVRHCDWAFFHSLPIPR